MQRPVHRAWRGKSRSLRVRVHKAKGASDEARWVTGQTLNVDAGTTAGHTGVPGIHELEANKVRS